MEKSAVASKVSLKGRVGGSSDMAGCGADSESSTSTSVKAYLDRTDVVLVGRNTGGSGEVSDDGLAEGSITPPPPPLEGDMAGRGEAEAEMGDACEMGGTMEPDVAESDEGA